MLYSNGKGKYEKAYNYLFKKMVPKVEELVIP